MTSRLLLLAALVVLSPFGGAAGAGEWSGYFGVEGRLFPSVAAHSGQRDQSGALTGRPEFYHAWGTGHSVTVTPFFRIDSADPARSHFDFRELIYLKVFDDFEFRAGVGKVFWGVTESQHLVDIVNQTDLVELPDGEEKLGQPMLHLSYPAEWGTLDLFLLPYFRERTFPGRRGRLRSDPPVATGRPRFESGAGRHHPDWAVRYSHTIGSLDIGLSHFRGTGREPVLLPERSPDGRLDLIPFYVQINQTGLDAAWVRDAWLWKLEAIRRTGQGPPFFASTAGVEYTLSGVAGSVSDLGLIAEWLFDERGRGATTPFQNDLMAGLRLAQNDLASTEFLAGVILDLEGLGRLFTLEGNRRIGEAWKLSVELFLFDKIAPGDLLEPVEADDFLQLTLAYYF